MHVHICNCFLNVYVFLPVMESPLHTCPLSALLTLQVDPAHMSLPVVTNSPKKPSRERWDVTDTPFDQVCSKSSFCLPASQGTYLDRQTRHLTPAAARGRARSVFPVTVRERAAFSGGGRRVTVSRLTPVQHEPTVPSSSPRAGRPAVAR